MTVLVVTAQNTRIHDMNALTGQTVTSIGGGAGAALESTWFFQSTGFIARKLTNTATHTGFQTVIDSSIDMTLTANKTAILKYACATAPDLQNISVPGIKLRIGSDASNFEIYDVDGKDTFPPTQLWRILAIDPSIAGYVDDPTNGTPTLTAIDYWAITMRFVAGGAKDLNGGLDAIDVGTGLTVVSGDGADPAATFEDFAVFDIDTITNRFGYAIRNSVGIEILGTMILGNATATEFDSINEIVSFSDGRFAAGFSGLLIGLDNALNLIDFDSCVFLGKGNTTTTDTRPIIAVSGASGAHTAIGCTFDAFASITLTKECIWTDCTISNSGLIDCGDGADMGGCVVKATTVAANLSALEWDVALNPDGEMDDMTFTMGATLTHAIEFGLLSPLAMTLRNVTFNNYNASNNVNDSTLHVKRTSGTVTITIAGGTTPSFRTDGATVVIDTDVEITLTGLQTGSEVRVFDQGTGVELAGIESSGTSFAFTDAASNVVDIRIFHTNFLPADIEGFTIPASPASIPIQQVFDRNFSNP